MPTTDQPYSPRAGSVLVWVLQAMLAGIFVVAGCAKLIGMPGMVQVFEQIGLGQWFRVATGLIEVGCGVLLLVPATSIPAALVLAVTMVGATLAHLTVLPPPMLPAVLLTASCLLLAWLRRGSTAGSRLR